MLPLFSYVSLGGITEKFSGPKLLYHYFSSFVCCLPHWKLNRDRDVLISLYLSLEECLVHSGCSKAFTD